MIATVSGITAVLIYLIGGALGFLIGWNFGIWLGERIL